MGNLEVVAHMKIRPGQLEGFTAQAAEILALTRDKDTHTLRCDWFVTADRAECEAYADRAMATLRRAVAAGLSDVALLRRDIDLDPLRPRRDFQELLMDLSFPADPFQR